VKHLKTLCGHQIIALVMNQVTESNGDIRILIAGAEIAASAHVQYKFG